MHAIISIYLVLVVFGSGVVLWNVATGKPLSFMERLVVACAMFAFICEQLIKLVRA